MRRLMSMAAALSLVASAAWAQQRPVHVRGEIVAVEATSIQVKTREGATETIRLAPDYRLSVLVPARLADVKAGDFVGTANMPSPDGKRRALELVVFPESLRGSGEGDRDWDLQPDSKMTNATVKQVASDPKGRTLELTYQGGSQTVVVPEDVPVVTITQGDPSLLKPGAKVFLLADKQADGTLSAARVAIGKDGASPPM